MKRSRRYLAGCLLACAGLAGAAATATADRGSLTRGSGKRPGPALLYAPAAKAPQLTNAAPWRAKPILVSGASAYRSGEFLYQDFLYDDHGARADADPDHPTVAGSLFSPPNGSYSYPTGPGYAGNAADLVELRVKPLRSATALRLTLNTLIDPEITAATIAIGTSPAPRSWPHAAGVSSPAALFLTWHGRVAELRDAGTGRVVGGATAKVDKRRRQVDLRVAHSAWNPRRAKVRLAAGVGLWDRAGGRYLLPGAAATATTPGGAGGLASPPGLFNVAFRHAEPFQTTAGTTALTDPAWWRDRLQGHALATGDVSQFSALVDFGRLARGRDSELRDRPEGVPRFGRMNRILASHFEPRPGVDFSVSCGLGPARCTGQLLGRLQPYTLYVPRRPPAGGRYQLTLLLHSLTANYNQFSDSRNLRQFGERSRASLVLSPEARGPDGFYGGFAAADTFEAWADVARRYRLDPRRSSIAGYSMGGFGTFRLAARFPDLFARAQPTVGAAAPAAILASVRWVPFLMWNGQTDELVPPGLYEIAADELKRLRYRYELQAYAQVLPPPAPLTPQHLALALNDQYAPAARFLGAHRVVRNPPRVTFVRSLALDAPSLRDTADHAYWLSRIRVRDRSAAGTIDVRSDGFGRGEAPATDRTGSGTLLGGTLGARPFERRATVWGSAPRTRVRDRLHVQATNIASVRIDARRARVSCRAKVLIDSDQPVEVHLIDCPRAG